MFSVPSGRSGVLPHQYLKAAIDDGVLNAGGYTIPPGNIQPASVDLRLGEIAYRVRCSFLPGAHRVEDRMKEYIVDELDLHRGGAVLETGRPYLIPLKERLDLPATLRGKANPKSSTGRADVFTRVITDHSSRFDEISAGYHGQLYLEVVPLSFPIRVKEDLSLNQLRLSAGRTQLLDEEIRTEQQVRPLLFVDGRPVPVADLELSAGLFLGLDLRGASDRRVGYRARGSAPLLDMSLVGAADPEQFWEAVLREEGNRIVLTPKDFYLLMSHEAVSISPNLAAEMTAYDPTSGELRTHYAGFFDPGFGFEPHGLSTGSRAALEVRAHDVPFMIEHRQHVCRLTFEHMLEAPTMLYGRTIGSNYQHQTETLGKHFRVPTPGPDEPDPPVKEPIPGVPPQNATLFS